MCVRSFPPIARTDARVLILGSMPGKASLAANQYYAHSRNLFWPLLGELLGFDPACPYSDRALALERAGIALWDVLESCIRTTSLDSDIVEDSIVANDFPSFLASHQSLERIVFNGSKAERSFQRYVLPELADAERFQRVRVPSTSPANASIPMAEKRRAWAAAVRRR